MTSLAKEQAPSAAAAARFPFRAEEKLTRRPAAERNVQGCSWAAPAWARAPTRAASRASLACPTGDLIRDELASPPAILRHRNPGGKTVFCWCNRLLCLYRTPVRLNAPLTREGGASYLLSRGGCDLSSISEVKSFATKFTSMDKPLHVLVNNAGLLEHKRVTTAEGLELNFAVNVAATYTLTELVMPLLEKAAPDASSGDMYNEPLNKDLQIVLDSTFLERVLDNKSKERLNGG